VPRTFKTGNPRPNTQAFTVGDERKGSESIFGNAQLPDLCSTSPRNLIPPFPGIAIHHFPERLFTCPGFRSGGRKRVERVLQDRLDALITARSSEQSSFRRGLHPSR